MERHGLSQRHACRLVDLDRSTLRYQGKRPDDSTLRQRLRELAADRRRFGYQRLGWMLAREGHAMNHKRLYRVATGLNFWHPSVAAAPTVAQRMHSPKAGR